MYIIVDFSLDRYPIYNINQSVALNFLSYLTINPLFTNAFFTGVNLKRLEMGGGHKVAEMLECWWVLLYN